MKMYLTMLILVISLPLMATKYYVATPNNNGDDTHPGTITEPFATWQKLNDVLQAGDTAYIRGGNYTNVYNRQYQCRWYNLTGTADKMIKIWAYPGEQPIWDMSAMPTLGGGGMQNFAVQMNQCDYVWVKGLRIQNFLQQNAGTFILGWNMINSSHNILENITVDHIGGNGFTMSYTAYGQGDHVTRNSEYNSYINCDASYCEDPYTGYGNANGWNLAWDNQKPNIYISHTLLRGCRSFHNSDDGYDLYGCESSITWENCWSFYNGYDVNWKRTGDGIAWKLGRTLNDLSTTHLYTLVNCIAAHNIANGFDQNVDPGSSQVTGIIHFYNCFAYDQYLGFSFYQPGENIVNVLNNNISYKNGLNIMNYDNRLAIWLSKQVQDHNSWNTGGPTVSDEDFVSLNVAELERPRKADGSLPDVDFAHLMPQSDLVDAGTPVGYPYFGTAPDLGPFEVRTGAAAAVPVYHNSSVDNSSPSVIVMNYDLYLDYTKVPATSDFVVTVNSGTITIAQVEIVGSTVLLTLQNPISSGEIVKVSYNKPLVTSRLQTIYGGEAETISNVSVTNRIGSEFNLSSLSATVYPNPASSIVSIKFDVAPTATIFCKVYNSLGLLVYDGTIEAYSNNVQIPKSFTPDTYLVQMGVEEITYATQIFVVMN